MKNKNRRTKHKDIMKMLPTRKELDKRFADPDLLRYKVICHKCQKAPIDCKCDERWYRLFCFKLRLTSASLNVGLGYASENNRRLVNKFWRYI